MSLFDPSVILDLEEFQNNREQITVDIVMENAAFIEDKQTEQMEQGITREGDPIEPPYSPFTVQIKRSKGQRSDRVTLKDTGDFHASVKVFPGAKAFSIGATDPKTPKLERKYSSEIFGLTDDNLQEFIDDYLGPSLKERFDRIVSKIQN